MQYDLAAPCHFGVEAVVKRELQALGYEITGTRDGRVDFRADPAGIVRANISLRTPERVLLSGPGMEAGYSRGRAEVLSRPGDTVSLVPLIGPVTDLSLTGLEYPLDRARVELGSSLTVSNVLLADRAEITHSGGVLLVVRFLTSPDRPL